MGITISSEALSNGGPTWVKPAGFNLIYAALVISLLLSSLDQTIVSTALPTVVGELGNVTLMSWVITAYTLAMTISMPIYGKFGDVLGRRGLFLAAVGLFVLGSLLCGIAASVQQLIAFRALQGLGGGGIMVVSQAVIADLVPARERTTYTAPMGAVFGIASILGPLLGGFLTEHANWRWVFWINLPLGVAAFIVSWLFLKLPKPGGALKADYAGIALISIGVTALTLLSGWGGTTFAWTSPEITGLAILTAAAAAAFIYVETRAKDPIIPLSLFSSSVVSVAIVLSVLASLGLFAAVSYMPTYLQMAYGLSATASGYMMIAAIAGIIVASAISGWWSGRTGHYQIFLILGMGLIALGLLLLATTSSTTPIALLGIDLLLVGLGIGCVIQLLVVVVQNAVPASEVGTATSSISFFREIGATLGTAIIGGLFTARLATRLGDAALGNGITANTLSPASLATLSADQKALVIAAYSDALMPLYLYLVPVFAIGVFLAVIVKEQPLTSGGSATAP